MKETATSRRPLAMAAAGGVDPAGGATLRLAIVGPARPDKGAAAAHATALAHRLAQAGHDVTLVSWSHPFPGTSSPAERSTPAGTPEVPEFPRTIRSLSWARPDTWVRTGRHLRGFDAVIVVHVLPIAVPAYLCVLRAAGAGGGTGSPRAAGAPRSIVVAHSVLPHQVRPGDRALMRSLFERVDAVLVHSPEQGRLARDLNAARVTVADPVELDPVLDGQQEQELIQTSDLSSPWAHYVGAMEALASPRWQSVGVEPADTSAAPLLLRRWSRLAAPVRLMVRSRRPRLFMTRSDLPEGIRPSDVLDDGADADDARDWARSYGLPRCADPVAAWSALGALAAIVRLTDDGQRSAVIIDGSGPRSPLSSWARAIGFAPVEVGSTGGRAWMSALDVDLGSLDVITRLHPNGCDCEDVDEALSQASLALRSGGLISRTLPRGPASADGAVGPPEVRAVLARAHALGFVLVGDLDGELMASMRAAREGARRSDAAYGLLRLTFRRR